MEVIETIYNLREKLAALKSHRNINIGFVPTMGYLHQGHVSLMKAAREQSDVVVLSIFVNPLQFGVNEDFDRYPRDTERDLQLASDAGVHIVFMPGIKEMYPQLMKTKVSVSEITSVLCGAARPGHFDGVATVVTKLFNIVQPDKAFFGLKDAQQVAVITQMVQDLNMPLEIVPCPIVREADGLAMSSRNVYLSSEERKQAIVLSDALLRAEGWIKESETTPDSLKIRIREYIQTAPSAHIDYVEILQYPSLMPIKQWAEERIGQQEVIIALAVKFGSTRLIDNRIIPFC